MTIAVEVNGGGGVNKGTIHVNIVDLDENPPPDPNADDRKDDFTLPDLRRKHRRHPQTGCLAAVWQEYWVWHSCGDGDGYWAIMDGGS